MRRQIPIIACLALLSTTVLGACDADRVISMPEGDDQLVLEDYTDRIELPADDSVEPTGQPCEVWSAAAPCLDGLSAAFCDLDYANLPEDIGWEFRACMPVDEVECWPGETRMVETECGDLEAFCNVWNGIPNWELPECFPDEGGDTPLVLRFDDAPIEMIASEATPAATFDIAMAADGNSCITTDWPSAATPWLAVDLDRSGTIDGGHELFGSGTDLAPGHKAQNGFIALAEFDANRDGVVDGRDPRFGELLLWRDHDGDRQSSPAELEPLAEAGVDSLALDYRVEQSCDARGNCAIERASFGHSGGRGELVDLHLACQ